MPVSRHFLPIPPELGPDEARFQLLYRQLLEARGAEREAVKAAIAELRRRMAAKAK